MQLNFNIAGVEQVSRNLRILAVEVPKLNEVFKNMLDIVEARTDAIFDAQGSNVEKAGTWPGLAESTLKARKNRWGYYKRAPSRPSVMRWTGNMQQGRTRSVTKDTAKLTFTAKQAIYHQNGNGNRPPQRVIVDLSNPTIVEMVRTLQTHIQEKIGIFGRQV